MLRNKIVTLSCLTGKFIRNGIWLRIKILVSHLLLQEKVSHSSFAFVRISKDKIGDVSIKRHIGHDEQWTRALKYTLHDTKWILAFAASVSHTNYKRRLE